MSLEIKVANLLNYFREMRLISVYEASDLDNDGFERGYAAGQKAAYEDAIEGLTRAVVEASRVHTEPKSANLQEQ